MCTHVCKLRCTHIASSSGVCTLRRTHTRRARAVVLTGMPACKHTHHPENPGFRSYKFTLLLGVLHRSMHMVHCSFKSVDARPRQLSRVPSYDSSTVLIDTAPPSNPVYWLVRSSTVPLNSLWADPTRINPGISNFIVFCFISKVFDSCKIGR